MMAHMVMRGQKPVVTFKHSLIIMEAPSLDQASQREEWTRDSDEGGDPDAGQYSMCPSSYCHSHHS